MREIKIKSSAGSILIYLDDGLILTDGLIHSHLIVRSHCHGEFDLLVTSIDHRSMIMVIRSLVGSTTEETKRRKKNSCSPSILDHHHTGGSRIVSRQVRE